MSRRPEDRGEGSRVDPTEPDDPAAEVDAELEAHFEGTIELLVSRGWSEDDAHAEALRRFGDVARYRRELEGIVRRRRVRGRVRSAVAAVADAGRAAGRRLVRAPGLSAAVVITLALGLGANAAVFRVVDRLLLSPPERVDEPDRVRRLHQTLLRDNGEPYTIAAFNYPDVQALRRAGLGGRVGAVVKGLSETLGEGEGAIRVRVARPDSAYLPLLGVRAALGRTFAADDHRPDAAPVALLGHDLWTSRFGSDPEVAGRTIRIAGTPLEIVGVLPRGFVGAQAPAVDVWVPVGAGGAPMPDWASNPALLGFRVAVRLDAGASTAAFADRATDVLRRARADGYALRGELDAVGASSLVHGDGPDVGPMVALSRWLAGVALLVLLVACANVANLLLAHGERVRRETAVRMALGAGRGRIAAELAAGMFLLGLLGAAGALLVASWGGDVLDELFLGGIELGGQPRNGRLIGFVAAAALAAAFLSALLPALRTPEAELGRAFEGEGRTATGTGRLRRMLVAIQAALSAVLVIGALLFVLSFRTALEVDVGFDHERLLMVRLERGGGGSTAELYDEAARALSNLPGVASVSSTVAVPFVLLYGMTARLPEADTIRQWPDDEHVAVNAVGERFFETMGVPLLRGRALEAADLEEGAAPVAVVGRAAAERLWPGADPVGRCLALDVGGHPCVRVVGVAAEHLGNTRASLGPAETVAGQVPPPLMAWVPLHVADRATPSALMVRTEGPAARSIDAVRRRVYEDPSVRFAEVEPMSTFVDRQSRSWRLGATVFSLFGALALGVAAVGLYGVLAYDVARRRREIGIRMALGARRGRLVAGILAASVGTVAAALAVALPAAAWGAARLASLLFRVSPHEPAVFVATAGLMLVTAAIAAAYPAWRATRVDPREALAES